MILLDLLKQRVIDIHLYIKNQLEISGCLFCSCFYGFQIRFQNCFEGVVLFLFAFYYSIYFQQTLIAVGKQDDCDKRLHLFMSSLMFNIVYS